LDTDLILRMAREHEILLTLEEGSIGGFGSHVMNFLATQGMLDGGLKCRSLMLPDCYIDHNNPMRMYDLAGLNAAQIVIQAKSLLNVGHVEIVNLKPKKAE